MVMTAELHAWTRANLRARSAYYAQPIAACLGIVTARDGTERECRAIGEEPDNLCRACRKDAGNPASVRACPVCERPHFGASPTCGVSSARLPRQEEEDVSGIEACDTCHAGLVSRWRWKKYTRLQRQAAIADGFRAKNKAGQCDRCALAVRRAEIAAERHAIAERAHAVRLEDLRWMADTGESLVGAASRLGLTADGVEKFLKRVDERGLLLTLLRRNPRDHNAPSNRTAVIDAKRPPRAWAEPWDRDSDRCAVREALLRGWREGRHVEREDAVA